MTDKTTKTLHAEIKKAEDDQRLVFAEVYAPDKLDSQKDFASAEVIRKAAYDFLANARVLNVDTNHDRVPNGSVVVESFIAREGDPDFIPGSWVIGVYVPSDDVWAMVKSGELNGFSLDGTGIRTETEITLVLPEVLKGRTTKAGDDDHDHEFIVWLDKDGNFIGGMTDEGPDGSKHEIIAGTVTEVSKNHKHLFSYVEGVILVRNDDEDADD
ncbi:DNA methyltransferase/prohead protease protein [Rhizobium phage RHph_Y1_11]|nr:DNA methyltransferase/prohead protease protein [Rhizobium phage RHph_Y1_11]